MVDYKEILRLHHEGYSQRQIEASLHCSRHTIRDVLKEADRLNLVWPPDEDVSNREWESILFPNRYPSDSDYLEPDCAYIHRELAKPHVTMTLLWSEYREQCESIGRKPYMPTQFSVKYRKWARVTKATMRIQHKPGDAMEVDWAGQTIPVYDSVTGESAPAYLFVAALPCSGYAYVEACPNMKLETWILCHVHAYAYFGGVTRLLIPDNLKTGVTKNTRYETILNRSYQEMASYYDTAVVPARVERPQDKSHAEATVRFASAWILAALRNEHFFTLDEVQREVRKKLAELNERPLTRDRTRCRRSAYEEEERAFMRPLPSRPYECSTWIPQVLVSHDYLISDGKNKCSAPFDLIGEKVDIRLTPEMVEVYFHAQRVASHPRQTVMQKDPIINPDHMTPEHRKYLNYNTEDFLSWARENGRHTEAVVQSFLTSGREVEQGFKFCASLMKLGETYGADRLEQACGQILQHTATPSIRLISTLLKHHKKAPSSRPIHPEYDNEHGITRGPDYYGKTEKGGSRS